MHRLVSCLELSQVVCWSHIEPGVFRAIELIYFFSRAELGNLYDEQITNLCYLALGYAHNLGITKIPLELLQQMGMDNAPEDVLQTKKESFVAKLHSMDEKRAFLGCFCLISV